jgi:hypothetical protein
MIKTKKGLTKIDGTSIELLADATAIVHTIISDEDLCEGKTIKERGEWFKKYIVDTAVDSSDREKAIRKAAQEIAKLLGKGTGEILTGILKAMEVDDDDDDDDEDDYE